MRLASTGVDELVGNVRWLFDKRLEVMEEVALDPQGSGTVGSGKRDAYDRLHRAWEMGDKEVEDEAVVDHIRAETREQWSGTLELKLLTKLYRRVALRKTGCGSQSCDLEDYIESSEAWRAYFDALLYLVAAIRFRGEQLPVPLFFWWLDYAVGRRQRPQLRPFQAHRPVNSANLVRDVEIHFTIEILRRVGVAPQGDDFSDVSYVSGCRIVAEVLGLSIHSVIRIWKERIWKRPLEPVLRRYLEAVSERTGLVYDAEVSAHPASA